MPSGRGCCSASQFPSLPMSWPICEGEGGPPNPENTKPPLTSDYLLEFLFIEVSIPTSHLKTKYHRPEG